MGAKYFIFFVIATIAQSFVALGSRHTQNTCGAPSSTEIDADLKTIDFAELTGHMAYNRTTELIFSKIISTLTGDADSPDATILLNETVTALMLGIGPAWDAVRTIQPNVDIAAGTERVHSLIVTIAEKIYQAIAATTGENYSKNRAAFEKYKEETASAVSSLSGSFLTSMANSTSLPPEIENLLACSQAKITSEIRSAFQAVFSAIEILLSRHSSRTSAKKDDLSVIKAAAKKAFFYLKAEVTHKYGVIRNLRIFAYFSQTGILPGVFALRPVFANSVVGTHEGR